MDKIFSFVKNNKIITFVGAVIIAVITYFVPGSGELADTIVDKLPGVESSVEGE